MRALIGSSRVLVVIALLAVALGLAPAPCYGAKVQPLGSPGKAGLLPAALTRECALTPPPALPALAAARTQVTMLKART
jgi:hypothetical protein